MTTRRILTDFGKNRYSDAELVVLCERVVAKLENNPDFIDPNPSLDVIREAMRSYSGALSKSWNGSLIDRELKRNKRKELEQLMKRLASYAELESEGDMARLLGSGFPLSAPKATIHSLPRVSAIKLIPVPQQGVIGISYPRVIQARYYRIAYTEAPVSDRSEWTYLSTTKHKKIIGGLVSGRQYAVKVAAMAANTEPEWSEVVYGNVF